MEIESIIGSCDSLNIVKDPFNKESIERISIFMGKDLFGKTFFSGQVEFENGNTKGVQKFNGDNLVDVFVQVKNFCMGLK